MPLPNNISNRNLRKLDTQETQHNFENKVYRVQTGKCYIVLRRI